VGILKPDVIKSANAHLEKFLESRVKNFPYDDLVVYINCTVYTLSSEYEVYFNFFIKYYSYQFDRLYPYNLYYNSNGCYLNSADKCPSRIIKWFAEILNEWLLLHGNKFGIKHI
jgi:hypothetical protein